MKVPGPIIRLVNCDNPTYMPHRSSYESYHVLRVPDFETVKGNRYSPKNKGYGLEYWLYSDSSLVPDPDDVIILADPDQVFVSNDIDISQVQRGFGMAGEYFFGEKFLDTYKRFCKGSCSNLTTSQMRVGPPFLLTAYDFRRLAPLWNLLTEEFRPIDNDWLSDMYSMVIAAARLNIVFTTPGLTVTNPTENREPWQLLHWGSVPSPPLFILHYQQKYTVEDVSWFKQDFRRLDVQNCTASQLFPEPSNPIDRSEHYGKRLSLNPGEDDAATKELIVQARNVWMYERVVLFANQAFRRYYAEFC